MKFKTSAVLFLIICVIIAILLLTDSINSFFAGILFALLLVIIGVLSKGFKNK
ncbi:MAG: hypothetical protein IIC75_01305 [Bacteroidetes bacterium]|nr:hypothetical protein [Bacteroidota bacterium]